MTTVQVATGSGRMPMFDARPARPPDGAVIVIQEAFGVTAHIEDVTRRFADVGLRAVAPHLFYRTGAPVLSYDDIQSVLPHMQAMTESGLTDDVDAVLGYLEDAGNEAERVGIVGFCMGGTAAFLIAAHRRLGAAVTFYGGGVAEGRWGSRPLTELAPALQTPWLGLYGDEDQGIPGDQVEALRAAAATAAVPTEVVRYPDAGHGFFRDVGKTYNEPAAKDAWNRTLEWFARLRRP